MRLNVLGFHWADLSVKSVSALIGIHSFPKQYVGALDDSTGSITSLYLSLTAAREGATAVHLCQINTRLPSSLSPDLVCKFWLLY